MTNSFIILVLVLFLAFTGREPKTELLCHKWREIGTKYFSKRYQRIDKSQSELVEFKKDGSYEKLVYGNLQFKGRWLFSDDSAKLALSMTEMNGVPEPPGKTFSNRYANDSLITLTSDSLVIGQLKYFGPEKIYGHDDIYYVREN